MTAGLRQFTTAITANVLQGRLGRFTTFEEFSLQADTFNFSFVSK